MTIKIVTAYDYKQLGKKAKRFTPWFPRKFKPCREGTYKMRLVSGHVMRVTWTGKGWRDRNGQRVLSRDIQGWCGLTKSGYDATLLTTRDDVVGAFPEHRVPTDTVFERMVRDLGPVLM